MALVPAYCPNCGAIFAIPNLIGGNGRVLNLTIRNSRTTCPVCRNVASILDGTYSMANDELEFTSGPEFTRQVLEQIRSIYSDARSGKKSPAVAVSQALDLLPPDARALVEKLPTDNPILVIAFILWLLTSSLGIVKTGVDIAASFGKEQPVATTQVNTTNIYYGVPVDSHAEASLKPVKREVQRRLDQERRRQEKMHRAQQKRSN